MNFRKLLFLFRTPEQTAKAKGVVFGRNCQIARDVEFGTEPYLIEIGDNFYSSSNVKFVTHDGSVNVIRNLHTEFQNVDILERITVGHNVFIGMDTIILPGTIIGDNVIVGAKSLVRGEIPPNSVFAGVPAKFICTTDEYLQKNVSRFHYTKHLSPRDKERYIKNNIR